MQGARAPIPSLAPAIFIEWVYRDFFSLQSCPYSRNLSFPSMIFFLEFLSLSHFVYLSIYIYLSIYLYI